MGFQLLYGGIALGALVKTILLMTGLAGPAILIAMECIILLGAIGFIIYMMMKPNGQVADESNTMTVGMWIFVGLVIAVEICLIILYAWILHVGHKLESAADSVEPKFRVHSSK